MLLLAKVRDCCKAIDTDQNKRLKAILKPSRRAKWLPAPEPTYLPMPTGGRPMDGITPLWAFALGNNDTYEPQKAKGAKAEPRERRIKSTAARPAWIKHIPIKPPPPRRIYRRDVVIRAPNQRHEIKLAELAS